MRIGIAFLAAGAAFGTAQADPVEEMVSPNYRLAATAFDTTGRRKASASFQLLDAVGQVTPVGFSGSDNFLLESGFLLAVGGKRPLDKLIPDIIAALNDLLAGGTLGKNATKKIDQAIKFLEDALAAYQLYLNGDPAALANALNKSRRAIANLVASGADTTAYQQMLAEAAQLAVTVELNRIGAVVGETNPFLVDAVLFAGLGDEALLGGLFETSVQNYTQAYNNALLAL